MEMAILSISKSNDVLKLKMWSLFSARSDNNFVSSSAIIELVSTLILFITFFPAPEEIFCLKLVTELRSKGIAAELYPDRDKIKKQMSYADSRKIPFVAFIGEEEMKSGKVKLKDMKTGIEERVSVEEIPDFVGGK